MHEFKIDLCADIFNFYHYFYFVLNFEFIRLNFESIFFVCFNNVIIKRLGDEFIKKRFNKLKIQRNNLTHDFKIDFCRNLFIFFLILISILF